jgi:geranylgeranyl pyrophosphate synthase
MENAVPLQIALTFIDATMDIHDDIIDDSFSKRNKKTIYGKLGKSSALLVGDAFIVKGFYRLHQAIEHLSSEKKSLIMKTVDSFLAEVVRAHIAETQLRPVKWTVKPQAYMNILRQKAADIEGRMIVAAIYAGGNENEIQAIGKYGRNLGILLAVRAEYTDLFEPYELLNRIKSECLPLPITYALQKRGYDEKIKSLLMQPNLTKKDTYRLLEIIAETGALESLNHQLKDIQQEGKDVLRILVDTEGKKHLELIITSMLEDM